MPLKNSLPKLGQKLPIYQDQRVVIDRAIDNHIKKPEKLANLLPVQQLIHSDYETDYRYDP